MVLLQAPPSCCRAVGGRHGLAVAVGLACVVSAAWLGAARGRAARGLRPEELPCGDVIEWARSHGARIPKLAVTDFVFQPPDDYEPGADGAHTLWYNRISRRRGTIATAAIAVGEEVLSVPRALLLSVANARASPALQRVFDHYGGELDDYTALALFILLEYHRGAASKFWPYLCSMPRPQDLTTTLYWPKRKLKKANITTFGFEGQSGGALTKGNLALQTERLRELVLHKYNTHVPMLLATFPDLFQRDFLNFNSWTWALTLVYSRNWGVTDPELPHLKESRRGTRPPPAPRIGAYGKSSHTLVPLADLLNHHDPVTDPLSCFLDWRENGSRIAMVARRRYDVGEEVFTSYGSVRAPSHYHPTLAQSHNSRHPPARRC